MFNMLLYICNLNILALNRMNDQYYIIPKAFGIDTKIDISSRDLPSKRRNRPNFDKLNYSTKENHQLISFLQTHTFF